MAERRGRVGFRNGILFVSVMALFFSWLLPSFLSVSSVSAATILNADQKTHELEIRADGRFFQYTIAEGATVSDICESGCEIVLITSGQSLRANENDIVVIDQGVIKLRSGDTN